MKRIFDPIHRFIELDDGEVALLGEPVVQRLRRLRQDGLAFLAFPSAEHSRFTHALGALAVGEKVLQRLRVAAPEAFASDADFAAQRRLLRASLLLHDLGHGPFSHACEAVLGMRHEARTTAILALPGLRAALARLEVEPDEVLALVLGDERCRYPVLRELVSGPNLDADRMDYLLRDAYFTGVEGGGYDFEQLVASLRIFEHGGRPALGVDWRGVHALEGFVLARYFMFSTVYFHHTTRQFERVLHEALRELWPQPRALDPIEEFLAWDDFRAFEGFRTLATPAARAIRERKPTHALVAEFNAARDLVAFERVRTALATRFGESLWIDQQEQLLHRLPLGAEGEAPTVLVRNFGGLVDAREASDLIARLAGKAYWRKIFVGRTGNDCAEARRIARAAVRAAGSGDERSGGVRGAVVTGT